MKLEVVLMIMRSIALFMPIISEAIGRLSTIFNLVVSDDIFETMSKDEAVLCFYRLRDLMKKREHLNSKLLLMNCRNLLLEKTVVEYLQDIQLDGRSLCVLVSSIPIEHDNCPIIPIFCEKKGLSEEMFKPLMYGDESGGAIASEVISVCRNEDGEIVEKYLRMGAWIASRGLEERVRKEYLQTAEQILEYADEVASGVIEEIFCQAVFAWADQGSCHYAIALSDMRTYTKETITNEAGVLYLRDRIFIREELLKDILRLGFENASVDWLKRQLAQVGVINVGSESKRGAYVRRVRCNCIDGSCRPCFVELDANRLVTEDARSFLDYVIRNGKEI